MVDIDTGRIIDLIFSRDSSDVAEWLKTYPNIAVVSRDGSSAYAKAIRTAHPNAIQVSDRFHLLQGLTDAAKKYVTGIIATRIRVESDQETGAYWEKEGRSETDFPERSHNSATQRRAARIKRVRELSAQGLTKVEIVNETGLSYCTVKKYINESFDPGQKNYGESYPSKLKPYTSVIDEMLTKQKKFREIEETIRTLGYDGAASTIRMYATRKRKHDRAVHNAGIKNTEIIERKWLVKLLYKPLEKVKSITESQLEKVLRDYPELAAIYHIAGTFKDILLNEKVDELDDWIKAAEMLKSEDIGSFLNGLSRDKDAVKNAIIYEYNNGLAEGSINKVKLYKRIMYGRCSFETLRCKTLMLENEKYIN